MMGQEKSVPIRCNTCHNYSSAIKASVPLSQPPAINRQPSTQPSHKTAPSPAVIRSPSHHHRHSNTTSKSSKSIKSCPSKHYNTTSHTRSTSLSTARCIEPTTSSLYKAHDTKTKTYLDNQLHIKGYLEIDDEPDRTVPLHFRPAKNGIRNYTPKILLDQSTPTTSTSASSTSSNEPEDIDIWI